MFLIFLLLCGCVCDSFGSRVLFSVFLFPSLPPVLFVGLCTDWSVLVTGNVTLVPIHSYPKNVSISRERINDSTFMSSMYALRVGFLFMCFL